MIATASWDDCRRGHCVAGPGLAIEAHRSCLRRAVTKVLQKIRSICQRATAIASGTMIQESQADQLQSEEHAPQTQAGVRQVVRTTRDF